MQVVANGGSGEGVWRQRVGYAVEGGAARPPGEDEDESWVLV